MLEFIIKEPQANEADQDRGHSIPFHSDMVFQFGKEHINGTFFRSEAQDRLLQSQALGSVDQKASNPQQMIDVFMTPQSDDPDDDLSDDNISPTDPLEQDDSKDNEVGKEDKCDSTMNTDPIEITKKAKEEEPEVSSFKTEDHTDESPVKAENEVGETKEVEEAI